MHVQKHKLHVLHAPRRRHDHKIVRGGADGNGLRRRLTVTFHLTGGVVKRETNREAADISTSGGRRCGPTTATGLSGRIVCASVGVCCTPGGQGYEYI